MYAIRSYYVAKKEAIFEPPLNWVGYENNYFIQALIPIEKEGYKIKKYEIDL